MKQNARMEQIGEGRKKNNGPISKQCLKHDCNNNDTNENNTPQLCPVYQKIINKNTKQCSMCCAIF